LLDFCKRIGVLLNYLGKLLFIKDEVKPEIKVNVEMGIIKSVFTVVIDLPGYLTYKVKFFNGHIFE